MPEFTVHPNTEQAQMLALKLPDGDFWLAKYIEGTNLNKLLLGFGLELLRLESNLNYVSDELSLVNTNDLIDEWEKEFGIPGSCFASLSQGADIETRVNNILTKIAADGTSIEEQFEAVALSLGLVVDVINGKDYSSFPFTFPMTFIADSVREARFMIVVDLKGVSGSTFPLTFPITFGDPRVSVLKCFFNKLKPANTKVIYVNE